MANYIVQDTSLATVADAIRAKTGGTEKLVFPAGFVEAVGGIKGGGGSVPFYAVSVKEGGDYTAESVVNVGVGVSVTAEDYVA